MITKNKRKEFSEEIKIPEGVNLIIEKNEIVMSKGDKEIRRKLNNIVSVRSEGDKIILSSKKTTRREIKILYTFKAHIKNMVNGLTNGFKYKLQAVSVHFPMTLELDKDTNSLLIKNFLGEKKPRVIKLIPGVEVKINKEIIELESPDIEKAGQIAANIEKGTKVRKRDRRVFQDGVFIISKPKKDFI